MANMEVSFRDNGWNIRGKRSCFPIINKRLDNMLGYAFQFNESKTIDDLQERKSKPSTIKA